MASTLFFAPTTNFKQTSLNGNISDSVQTITLNSTSNLTAPGYIVIDRQDSAGTDTPLAREVIYYTGISGNDLTGCVRAADSSTARSHSSGAIVETMPTVGMWNSLTTIVGAAIDGSGYLRAINSPVSISFGQLTRINVPSIASIAQAEITTLNATNINSGVKGHFLWTVTGALTTSLATSTNTGQIAFLRATKNLTLSSVYFGLNSAPSLGPAQFDIHYKSTPTGVTGTSIFSVLPLVGIGLNENTAGATGGTLNLTSLASGTLLYPEIKQPQGAGDLTLQLVAVERV